MQKIRGEIKSCLKTVDKMNKNAYYIPMIIEKGILSPVGGQPRRGGRLFSGGRRVFFCGAAAIY